MVLSSFFQFSLHENEILETMQLLIVLAENGAKDAQMKKIQHLLVIFVLF